MHIAGKFLLILSICLPCGSLGDRANEANDACVNTTLCDNTTIMDLVDDDEFEDINIKELATNIFKFTDNTKTSSTTESSVDGEVDLQEISENSKIQKILEERSKIKFCNCDLTVNYENYELFFFFFLLI